MSAGLLSSPATKTSVINVLRNIRVVDVVANSANVIAADPSVRYVSLDAQVRTEFALFKRAFDSIEQIRLRNLTSR